MVLDVHNDSKAPVTLVTHPRYLVVELLDAGGQFVRGQLQSVGLPGKKDFVDLAPKAKAIAAFVLPITREGEVVSVGPWAFKGLGPLTEVRFTYKSDPVVPNLPSNKRGSFFPGPAESGRLAVDLAHLPA